MAALSCENNYFKLDWVYECSLYQQALCFCSVFLFLWVNTGWVTWYLICGATYITHGAKISTFYCLPLMQTSLRYLAGNPCTMGLTSRCYLCTPSLPKVWGKHFFQYLWKSIHLASYIWNKDWCLVLRFLREHEAEHKSNDWDKMASQWLTNLG